LRALKFYGVARLERAVILGPEARKPLSRIAAEVPIAELEEAPPGRGPRLCQGPVCFSFDPPGVRRGNAEYSIIRPRLKLRAVEASTDGSRVKISYAP
jgi:hypothetical protein